MATASVTVQTRIRRVRLGRAIVAATALAPRRFRFAAGRLVCRIVRVEHRPAGGPWQDTGIRLTPTWVD